MPDPDDSVRAELVPDPVTLIARLNALSDKLHELRNRVQGRGVTPVGPAALAAELNSAQENWLEVRAALFNGHELIDSPYDTSDVLEQWERRYNSIVDKAIAAGHATAADKLQVTHTASTAAEALDTAKQKLSGGLSTTAITALIFVGGGLLGAFLWSKHA